jgi:hypothetical protein
LQAKIDSFVSSSHLMTVHMTNHRCRRLRSVSSPSCRCRHAR